MLSPQPELPQHPSNGSPSSQPCPPHLHAGTSWAPTPNQPELYAHHLPVRRAAPASHLGGHHHTKVGVSLLTRVPGKPRCPCQIHVAHTPTTVSPSPHWCPGLHGPHTCHWRAWQPNLRPRTSGRPPRALDAAQPAAPRAPRPRPSPPRPRSPLPPARCRARPAAAAAATATSILGSPRPRFTNTASAGRRRRREGRLRPPGDAASFT